jgi:hypothetical protein
VKTNLGFRLPLATGRRSSRGASTPLGSPSRAQVPGVRLQTEACKRDAAVVWICPLFRGAARGMRLAVAPGQAATALDCSAADGQGEANMIRIVETVTRRTPFALVALAAALLIGKPAAALDQTALEDKVIDCLKVDDAQCVECGADPGIYCCIKGLHNCTIKPSPFTPSPQHLRRTGFPTIRAGLGSNRYFTR